MSTEELLRALLGDAGTAQGRGRARKDPISDMLQQILGGSPAQAGAAGGGSLEDILGAIMGAGAGRQGATQDAQSGGLMDLIGAILGGSGAAPAGATGLSPIAEGIAAKLGLPSGIAQMIVAFVVGKLLSGMTGGTAASAAGAPSPAKRQAPAAGQPQKTFDLDHLLETMGQDQSMVAELAQQTGLDAQTAQRGLQEVLGMLGAQGRGQGNAPSTPKQGGLDHLLDSW